MQISMNPLIALPIAAIALGTAIGIWYYLLRPVPEQQQNGTIQSVEFFAKEVVEKTELRNLRNADSLVKKSSYKLPDRFIYTIKLDDGRIARYQENALHFDAEPDYKVGVKLSVTYQLRVLPFGKEKILVWDISNSE